MASVKTVLGVDLRVTSVKFVELKKGNGGWNVVSSGMTEIPIQLRDLHPQLEEAKAEALRRLLSTQKVTAQEAVVVAAGSETLVKLYSLPKLPPAEVTQALRYKFSEEAAFPTADAIIDFYCLPGTAAEADKITCVAACLSRRLFQEIQTMTARANLKLAGITVLPEALAEVFHPDPTKVVSLIYLGKRTTNISIFRRGQFEFNRELPIGGEDLTLALAGEVKPEEAEKLKLAEGIPLDPPRFALVRPELEKIQGEILRTFEYFKSQSGEAAIDKIILTGGSSQTIHLPDLLSQGLGAAVETPKPLAKLDARLAGAAGAALCGAKKINLLPEEIKHRWQIIAQKLSEPLVLLSVLAAFFLLIYLLSWTRGAMLQRGIGSAEKKLSEYRPRLARLEEKGKAATTLKAQRGRLANITHIFEEVSRLTPESVILNSLSLSGRDLKIMGAVFERGETAENNLSRFVLALSSSVFLENVQLVQAIKNSEYLTEAFNFEITARLKGE